MATTTTKYILHYQSYHRGVAGGRIGHTKTYRKPESAISDLDAFRHEYRKCFENNNMYYRDGSGPISEEDLSKTIRNFFYVEKQTITSERLDW